MGKSWDDEFSQKITDLTGEIWTGRYDLKGLQTLENKIFAVICKDRKYQQEEMLKRLPSVQEMEKIIDDEEFPDDAAKEIDDLIKKKLKPKC